MLRLQFPSPAQVFVLAVPVLLLTLAGCASPSALHHASPKPTKTSASSSVTTSGTESLTSVLGDWDTALATSDEIGMFTASLDLPDAVKADCYPKLNADQTDYLIETATSATAELDAATGGVRALDIYKAWNGYVTFVKGAC